MATSSEAVESPSVRWGIAALSGVVLLAVWFAVRSGSPALAPATGPGLLARVNVALNAGAGLFLLAGLWCVRRHRIAQHRFCMLSAFALSSVFLVTYLLHHLQVGSVPFRGTGWLRPVYFSFLIPHVVLAGAIVPLALFTLYRAWTGRVAAHRRIARYTLPLWLFVSASGVVVFFLLYYAGA